MSTFTEGMPGTARATSLENLRTQAGRLLQPTLQTWVAVQACWLAAGTHASEALTGPVIAYACLLPAVGLVRVATKLGFTNLCTVLGLIMFVIASSHDVLPGVLPVPSLAPPTSPTTHKVIVSVALLMFCAVLAGVVTLSEIVAWARRTFEALVDWSADRVSQRWEGGLKPRGHGPSKSRQPAAPRKSSIRDKSAGRAPKARNGSSAAGRRNTIASARIATGDDK